MLVYFTVGNFLSFRDKKTLSLEAAPIKDNGSQIIEVGKHQILPSAALYGANSSGKSNFLHALGAFSAIVNLIMRAKIEKIDMAESLKSAE